MNDILDDLNKLMDFINSSSMPDDEKQQAINLCGYIHAGIVDKLEGAKDTDTGKEDKGENEDWGEEQASDLKEWMQSLQDSSGRY